MDPKTSINLNIHNQLIVTSHLQELLQKNKQKIATN
jgi:hypothetical protein